MTTTHTFQGLNTDSKPSSRVLNPPGGSSSNIFGGSDEPQRPHAQSRNNSSSVNQLDGQGQNAAAGPQQKPKAPRSGDDSFHNLFGTYSSVGSDKFTCNRKIEEHFDPPPARISRCCCRSPDTFSNIFGKEPIEHRKMFRSVMKNSEDSFTRLFGVTCAYMSATSTNAASPSSSFHTNNLNSDSCTQSASVSSVSSVHLSLSCHNIAAPKEEKIDSVNGNCRSVSRVASKFVDHDSARRRNRLFNDRGAFNPITGEPYDQPKPTVAPQVAAAGPSDAVSEGSPDTLNEDESARSNSVAGHGKPENPNVEKSDGDKPSQAAQLKKQQQQSGVFGGGAENVQEHRSTRVSQPPGGRSTKLW